ncbi:hypothetical protein NLG97_g2620 [Lecanicillium saksenae]|uniref:Uncharacterized protein n=1 Tax=Lecanicillium saksenae TaxID=468837 RepID=A0ACC1R291_9HYPO|nr:hypothetical protein NLG97_g2620 [Lecanicillium saksenae]
MVADKGVADALEQLRGVINTSIDAVHGYLAQENYLPLDLNKPERHPLRDRYDESATRALKCLSNAGVMLRALCDPDAFLHDVMFNFNDHTALYVACQADVANVIGEKSCSLEELASVTEIESETLSRFLRALCNIHIFREVAPDVFTNNELSSLLRSESKRALVGLNAEECRLASCKLWDVVSATRNGSNKDSKTAFNIAYQTNLAPYEYWEKVRPDLGARGAKAFTGKGINVEQYLNLYPWGNENDQVMVIDVGGGAGGATLPIVAKFPNLRLQVQDRPENENTFYEHLQHSYPNLAKTCRATFCGHNFFEPQPARDADIYFLRHILHNWQDEMASKILSNIASSMSSKSKLLICEHVLLPSYNLPASGGYSQERQSAPPPLLPHWSGSFTTRLDLVVFACLNAKQRTEQEFSDLAATAGLTVTKIWRNMGDEVIFENFPYSERWAMGGRAPYSTPQRGSATSTFPDPVRVIAGGLISPSCMLC